MLKFDVIRALLVCTAAVVNRAQSPLLVLLVAALSVVTTYYIRHVEAIGFYDDMCNAWQFTLWSMHAAPIVAFRLLLDLSNVNGITMSAVGAGWILHSLSCRGWQLRNRPWSSSYVAIELLVLCLPETFFSARWLEAALVCQFVIILGFWAGMIAASFSDSFSFLPLDRHLNKGWRHMLSSREAQRRLVHDMGGHGVMQLTFSGTIVAHLSRIGASPILTDWRKTIVDAALLLVFYAMVIMSFAALLDVELPYIRARVPLARLSEGLGKGMQQVLPRPTSAVRS